MSLTTVVVVVAPLLAVLAVCTGVGILVCCVVWMKRSESIWTKAEREEEKRVKKQKGPDLKIAKIKADSELSKQKGFKNSTASSYHYDVHVPAYTTDSAIQSTDQTTNSMETAQNEAYIETRHLTHIEENTSQAADTSNSRQAASVTSTSNTEIKTAQNAAYKKTYSYTTELGQNSSGSADESMYTYISNEQVRSAMKVTHNVAYIRSHHHATLDVIYEENQLDSVISRDRTQAGQNNGHNLNVNVHAYPKSETML